MNLLEKLYSLFAVLFALMLVTALLLIPELRYPDKLLLVCAVGFAINIGLMFVVLRDILYRPFPTNRTKYFWLMVVLLFWPSVLVYLVKHGFRPRTL